MATAFTSGDFIASTTSGEAASFVPEQWSNEVIAPYKASRVLAGLVTRWNFVGQYGDTVHVPTFVRGSANTKSAENVVTPNVTNSTLTNVSIDKHIEYTVLIEKFAEVQSMPSLRRAYVDDAGYAISRKIDWDLHLLGRSNVVTTPAVGGNVSGEEYGDAVIGSDGTTAWDQTANSSAGNAAALADAGVRRLLRSMDDNNVSMEGRAFVIPPVELESLRGIARFTEQAFTGESGSANTIRNGLIGDLYGTPIYVTSGCPFVHDGANSADQRAGLLLHKAAFVLVEQQRVEAVQAFLSEFLATQLTWHTIYGVKEVRATNVIPFIVPS
ncbi:hypothetical protein CMI47_04450 [Candidatus Pacearchaeota archaeon]|jgi:hypothetical protein|nr:hypothetical protein [Candidatus Pacearchaeota archaeon]|tara:strand:+ start:2882 stop:3862 length:981 start_codon:yes stop_codon:yes gene_type:complete